MRQFIGLVRIVTGLAILYFAGMKFFNADMGAISATVEQFGRLDFFSVSVWFWIVAIAEALAGLLLVTGRNHKLGALIILVIIGMATATFGFNAIHISFLIAGLLILFAGPGAWAMSKREPATIEGLGEEQQEQQQQ